MDAHNKMGNNIIYIDESGFSVDMPRTRGWSAKGTRCPGTADWNAKGRTNAIGAITGGKFVNVCLAQGNIDSRVFHKWLTSQLLPCLTALSVLVMDNATFHKHKDTLEAIQRAGHVVEFLPPYSPDLNPIERKWAQAKAIRRKHRCSVDELFSKYVIYL